MKRLAVAIVLVCGIAAWADDVERGKVGIGVEVLSFIDLLNASDFFLYSSSMPPLAAIAIRVSPASIIDIDMSYGFAIATKVEADSASATEDMPASASHAFSAGVAVNPFAANNTVLGIYARFCGFIQKDYDDIGMYPNEEYLFYYSFTPRIGLGIEPSYYFSKHFSVYFRTGLGVTFDPATKYAEYIGTGSTSDADSYRLKKKKNNQILVGTDGLALGLRFLF